MTIFADMDLTTDTKKQVFGIRERGAFSSTIQRARVPIQEVKIDLQVPEVKYVCCLTSEMFDEYMAPVFNDKKPCAFDIETAPSDKWRTDPMASLDAHRSEITGISFSHMLGTAIYVPLRHKSGQNFILDPDTFIKWLKTEFFERTDIIKIAHNISFEAAFMYKHGIVIQEPVYDTIAASQLTLKNDKAFRDLSDSGLKKLSLEILGIRQTEFADVTQGRFFDELDPQNYATVEYACADSDNTIRLFQYFEEWFRLNIPRHSFYCMKIDSPSCVYAGLMKYNGIGVNEELMLSKKAEAESKLEALRTEIDKYTGGIDIGKNAATDVFKKWLFTTQGFHVPHRTEKGRDSIDDESFQTLMDECRESRPEMLPMFERLQEYRKWGKLLSTYIEGYMQYINPETGRIHADLMPTVTDTSRFASRKPNTQNLPRKDNDPIGTRNFFLSNKGNNFLDFDFSQIELRVGAVYCRDEKMLEVYRDNGDIHAQTTSALYNISLEQAKNKDAENYKERRTIAKNMNFGIFFGLYSKGLQRTLKFKAGIEKTQDECEEYIDNLRRGYPGIFRWQEQTKKHAREFKYSETAFGFRRILKEIDSLNWGTKAFWERAALNTPVQGTAAGIIKLAMARLLKVFMVYPQLKPILQIHDELLFECPEQDTDTAAGYVKACMEVQPYAEFDVPIKAEGATGKLFGELKEL